MSKIQILPIVPLKGTVIFPSSIYPVSISNEHIIRVVEYALQHEKTMAVFFQKDASIEIPEHKDLHEIGSVVRIVKNVVMPGNKRSVILEGIERVRLLDVFEEDGVLLAKMETIEVNDGESVTLLAKKNELFSLAEKLFDKSPNITNEAQFLLRNSEQNIHKMIDVIALQISLSLDEKQLLLSMLNTEERLQQMIVFVQKELQVLDLKGKIHSKVRGDIDKAQREYFLREQLKAIQTELNGEEAEEDEFEELEKKIVDAHMPLETEDVAKKELKKLRKMPPSAAEFTVSRNYIDWLVDMPWDISSEDYLDLKKVADILDADHFGLEKVKRRIIEFLAVRKLKKDLKGPILCLVGPPGVGKTSLAKSVATAMGRKMLRISLGGVRDEAEIRGHRRTYIGAMPGKIIKNLKKAKTNNPVFVLDEIDKMAMDHRGDPASALLEVLDPEQNNTFMDHYLDVPFDLSKVLFIATANQLQGISGPLRDRMEVIELSSYTLEEKLQIAKRYIVPEQIAEHGITEEYIGFDDNALRFLIGYYTKEAGVRTLKREVGALCRSVAKDVAMGQEDKQWIDANRVEAILGPIRFFMDTAERVTMPGVAVGLAWTAVGGDILFIESTKMQGKGATKLSGSLGDVMKESASVAISYIRSMADSLGIDPAIFDTSDIHIHIPSGATPKDGPSAGVTLVSSLVSLFTGKLLKAKLAMTGEITLRGQVLPVGGIKEKVLAAYNAGITEIILPEKNRKDVPEIPLHIRESLSFHFCSQVQQVLDIALQKDVVDAVATGNSIETLQELS